MDASNQFMKPKWTPTGHLLFAQSGLPTTARTTSEWQDVQLVVGEGRDVVESVLQGADKDVSVILRKGHWSSVYAGCALRMALQCGRANGRHGGNLCATELHSVTSNFGLGY